MGANFLRQGELQNAIEYISHSVQILDSTLIYYRSLRLYLKPKPILQQESDLVDALNRLGVAYLRAGNAQEAIRAFERGLTIVKTSKLDAPAEGSLSLGLGQAYVAQKDFLRAMENLSKALQTAEARRQTSTIQAASNAIGEIFLQTEKPSEAISYYKKAIDSIESTRSLLESEEFRTTFFANKGQTYDGMILAQLRTGNVEEAFNYNERARSRAFLDILGNKVQLGRQRALLEEERALLAKISEVRAKLAGQGDDGEEESDSGPTQLRQELDAAQKAYTDFLAKVRNENKEQASLMNVEPLTVKQVQEILDPGVVVLEYFVTQDGVLLWIVDKDKVASVKVALLRKKLQAKVSAFREAIQQFDENDKFRQQSEELFRVLIQPALAHIRGKELLIIPHDVLHYVPFQALLAPNGKYLIEDYPINYLSSASLMQFTQEKRKAKGELTSILAQAGKVLALGNPDLNDPRMSLQFAGIEAKEIKALYPQSTVYLEKEATEEKAKTLSPQNDIVHFASHAELNENDPLASAILLAKSDKEDGRLEVREIFGMDLKASLVVLSACETGLGKLSSGDELVGLTRAFIYTGTPSVVVSLWKVDDGSTAALMGSFYQHLKTMTKVEALRRAQLEMIRGEGRSPLCQDRCRIRK